MEKDKLITIIRFDNDIDANMVKDLLENNGISCFLADDNIISVHPLYSNAVGRIKLQVFANKRDEAAKILKENNYDFKIYDKLDNIKAAPCSNCNSRKVYTKKPNIVFVIFSALFLFIPLIFRKRRWECFECEHEWVEPLTSNKIFFSILLLPIVLILWTCIYFEIKNFYINYDYNTINGHKDEINKLEMIEKIGSDKHNNLIFTISNIYIKKNEIDEAIDFLNDQLKLYKKHDETESINYNLVLAKLGTIFYEYKNDKCSSLNILKEAVRNFEKLNNDKWEYYQKYIDHNKITCEE